ncbi:leishmanolysin-like peptidase isoform X2 [Vespula squamosa]|uniref:Leishmanolysin-like peptidase isoform X2 n=1 Tax=Vespula squamosa TaxID=30214 RepID=A0ABD2B2P4_VESSQ
MEYVANVSCICLVQSHHGGFASVSRRTVKNFTLVKLDGSTSMKEILMLSSLSYLQEGCLRCERPRQTLAFQLTISTGKFRTYAFFVNENSLFSSRRCNSIFLKTRSSRVLEKNNVTCRRLDTGEFLSGKGEIIITATVIHGVHIEPAHEVKKRSISQPLRILLSYDESVFRMGICQEIYGFAVFDDRIMVRFNIRKICLNFIGKHRSLSLIRWYTLDKDIPGGGSFPSKSSNSQSSKAVYVVLDREMGKEKGQSFSSVIQFNSSSSNGGSSGDDGTSTRKNTSRHHRRVSL